MYIILGATGHIGSVLTEQLLERGESVMLVTRSAQQREHWERKGARIAIADVADPRALRQVFEHGKRAFLLNPAADPAGDTIAEERKTARSILTALQGSGLEKVVAISTYGAQPGEAIADLGVLYELEQGLRDQPIPASIIRGAYYMSNWDMSLPTARDQGQVYALFPASFELPMVAPHDIAVLAAKLLAEPASQTGLHFIEGPKRYAISEVAAAFAKALGRSVEIVTTPPEKWQSTLQEAGFSAVSARSMANMSKLTLEKPFEAKDPVRGSTTLDEYIAALVRNAD